MDISNHQFLNLYHSDFQHTTKQQNITKRSSLLQYINGDIFYPINLWPMKLQSIFWNKPIGDKETFELFLFFIGNGGSPHVIAEWILTSQAWADNKMEKRARQLDFIFNNKDNKSNVWFYFDLYHKDWRFLNGNKRTC